jgi:hypothetical protein
MKSGAVRKEKHNEIIKTTMAAVYLRSARCMQAYAFLKKSQGGREDAVPPSKSWRVGGHVLGYIIHVKNDTDIKKGVSLPPPTF